MHFLFSGTNNNKLFKIKKVIYYMVGFNIFWISIVDSIKADCHAMIAKHNAIHYGWQ